MATCDSDSTATSIEDKTDDFADKPTMDALSEVQTFCLR